MDNLYIGNVGYAALKKQSAKGTAVVPDVFVPYFSESVSTAMNKAEQNSVKGNRNQFQDVNPGQRSHRGSLEVLAEPNTSGYFADALMTKGSTSGSDPYTHPFTVGNTENWYTLDIEKGNFIERFFDVKINSMKPTFVDNLAHWELDVTGLKSFKVGKLASTPTGSGPYVVVLDTDYDPSPTDGLVAGEVLVFFDGTTEFDGTIAAVTNSTTLSITEDVTSYGAGDEVRIKATTPSYTLRDPFLWALTEFRFGATAAAALGATHTPLDQGSEFTLVHNNENDDGAMSSGSFDPADLRRTTFIAEFTADKVFDDQTDLLNYVDNVKRACVIRMFSEDQAYEFRVTLNNLKIRTQTKDSASDSVVHSVEEYISQYDSADAQAVDVKVLNAISSI